MCFFLFHKTDVQCQIWNENTTCTNNYLKRKKRKSEQRFILYMIVCSYLATRNSCLDYWYQKRRNRIQKNEDRTPSDPSLSEIGANNERGWIICIWEGQSFRQICPNLNIEVDLAFFDTWNLFHIFNYKKFLFTLQRRC